VPKCSAIAPSSGVSRRSKAGLTGMAIPRRRWG
jgi:hypothetical protein